MISGGIAWELGGLNPTNEFWSAGHLGQTMGHALVGGGVSEIQGGDFGSGALAAGLSAGLAPAIDSIGHGSTDIEYVAAGVTVSATIGGTAAQISGGKFANGAVTAAFLRLYNDERALRRFGVQDAINKLRGAASRYAELNPDYPDGQKVVDALQAAYDEGRIKLGDLEQFEGKSNPFITDRTTRTISINPLSKITGLAFPVLLAHEGQHLVDAVPFSRDPRFFIERRAFDVQHGFSRVIGPFQLRVTNEYIRQNYKPYSWEKR